MEVVERELTEAEVALKDFAAGAVVEVVLGLKTSPCLLLAT